ncbi:MAG: NTP transferase domain-containing protein [Peptococcaceae bacterium]|nr:NTP transferase domain-containing protein [Peptococcaceae bacterium]
MKAVLLAAGEGRRLRPNFNRPKPLVPLLGIPLITRNILTLRKHGIKEIVVIIGCYGQEIKAHLGTGEKLGVKIRYIHNPDWRLGNGMSAYAFRKDYRPGEKFILMMADHIFQPNILQSFIAAAKKVKENEILLAADRQLETVHDLDECTKIKAEQEYARQLGKNLPHFNAVDCGLFVGTSALLNSLSNAIALKQYALTDAVNMLAKSRQVRLHFVKGCWVDVDDQASYKHCEKLLLQSLVPPKDGFISRVLNRKLSLRITKLLAPTGIKPNQITLCSFLLTLAAAAFFAGGYPLCGGLLAQLSSIVDGVDGEIARAKFLSSNYGGLLDGILDRYGDFLLIMGMTYGWYSVTTGGVALLVGAAALIGAPMSMLFKEKFHALMGKPYIPETHDGLCRYLPANRDGRLFIIMLGGILNLVPAALVLLAVITHLQTAFRLCYARHLM